MGVTIGGVKEEEPEVQEEPVVDSEKERIIPVVKKKMGAGWQGAKKKTAKGKPYDASVSPFIAFTPPDNLGVMNKISYKNSSGNIEYMFNRNEQEAREEIGTREKWRKLSGEGYYFVESDPDRYQTFLDKGDLSSAYSTVDNKLRRRTSLQSALVGPLRYQTKSIPENIYAMFSSEEDINFTKYGWRRPALTQDLGSFVTRAFAQTGSILDIFGGVFSNSVRHLADFDAKRMEDYSSASSKSLDYAPYHVPTKEEVQDWVFKPEGDAMEQFTTMVAGGGGQAAVITKVFRTFPRGKKIWYQAAKKTMRKLEKEGRDVSFVRAALSGKEVAFGKAGRAVIDKKTGKIIRDVGVGKILTAKQLAKEGIEAPLGYNAAQRAIRGLDKPLTLKQIAGMSREQLIKFNMQRAKREAFKKQFNERVRRDFAKEVHAATANSWAPIRFSSRLMKKGSLEAATNPVKFLTQAGMAEVGLNGAMVLTNNYMSGNPDDAYALFGPMNLAIGIAGAMSSANLYSLGGATLKTITESFGISHGFRWLTGRDTLLPLDAMDALLQYDKGANEAIEQILSKYPKAKKRRVLGMIQDIAEGPMELRQDLIQNAEWSMDVIKDLRRTVFTSEADRELLGMTLGELSNNKYLMTLENHLIPTAREHKTVSLNIIGADAVIKMKRAKALMKLEEFLAKIDSIGMGTQLNSNTQKLIRDVQTTAARMRENLAPRATAQLKMHLEQAIEAKLMTDTLGETNAVIRNKDDKEAIESLLGIYEEFSKTFDDEATRLASLKNIAKYSQLQGAAQAQKRLKDLLDASGKGVDRANMGEVNNKFAQAYHNEGAMLRQQGSDAYDVARVKIQGLDIEGEEAEEFIKSLNNALKPTKPNRILNETISDVQRAVNVSVKASFQKNINEFLNNQGADVEIIQRINAQLHSNPIGFMNKLISNRNQGRKFLGIENSMWEELEIQIDVLSQYDVQRAVNQAIGKAPNRTIRESNLGRFKTNHDESIRKFEESTGGPESSKADIAEYRAAVENWKNDVVPATTNNRIWQKLEMGRKFDSIETFDKSYTEQILREEFYNSPTSFVQEATRLYGKFDPEVGEHVIKAGSEEAKYLNTTMKTFIDDIITEEGEKLASKSRLKKIKPEEFNQLIIPEDDIKVTDLGFGEIIFGDSFDPKIASKIRKTKEAIETYNKKIGSKALDIGDATSRIRNYDEIISENVGAQQALVEFDEQMVLASRRLAGDTAEMQEHIKIISKLASKIDEVGFAADDDFLNTFVFGSETPLDNLYDLAVTTGKMTPRDFNKVIRTMTVTGIRRLAETGPLKESIKKVRPDGSPDLAEQMQSLGVRKPNRFKRTILQGQEELPFAGKKPMQKIDPEDPFTDVDMSKPFKDEAKLGMTVSRDVDGLTLKAILNESDVAIRRALNIGLNDPKAADEHIKHMRIIADGLALLQRYGDGGMGPEVLKASKTTIGGMASRFYAVFSGRVSWRYVGIEALYMHMARNEAAAITEILADPVASRAIAYMIAYGVPDFVTLKTSDQVSAWLPYVAMKSSHKYNKWREDQYDGLSGKQRRKLRVEAEKELMKEGIISRKEGFITMPEHELHNPIL